MHRFVVLFGAGASFGAGAILPESPPLGGDLYRALAMSYPTSWGALPASFDEAFRVEGFERGMRLVFDAYGAAIPQLMREMAVYFVQFRPTGHRSLYCRFIDDLKKTGLLRSTAFSTLNYECVLEYSLLEHGESVGYFPDATADSVVPVWKLHGSCNMFAHEVQAGPGVTYGTGVIWEGGAQAMFDSNHVVEHCLAKTGLAPMMCLYMEGKPLGVSPSVISQIQTTWQSAVSDAEAVVVIGVRPLESDVHIWEPIAATNANLYLVGDQVALEQWCGRKRSTGSSEHLGSQFNEAYPTLLARLLRHGTL